MQLAIGICCKSSSNTKGVSAVHFVETYISNLDNINVCKIRAELENGNINVWCHSPIIQQWRTSGIVTFGNGELSTDVRNQVLSKAVDFLNITRKTADYVAISGSVHTFFETLERAKWYDSPIVVPDGVELFGEHGALLVKTVSDIIMNKYKFITFSDTLDTLVYIDGLYRPNAERVIAVTVQMLLGDKSKERHQKEINNYIKHATLVDRKSVYSGSRYINMRNGVYDRSEDKLIPHDSGVIFTYQIPVEYNPGARCPHIQGFLNDVMQPEDILCILEFFGYCLIPDTTIQKAVMLVGGGENGKSKLLGLLSTFVGFENTSRESLQGLEKDPYSGAELYGKLVNVFPDLPSAALFENTMFKTLTGDDGEIRARKIYGQPFKYNNTSKLIFSANQAPPVPRGDYAYYRRWLLFEFLNTFSGDKRDPNILEKITSSDELSGLFNMVIPALRNLMNNGKFTYSRSNEQVEKLYKIKSDPISAFADECIVYSDDDTPKRDIYQRYAIWCNDKKIKLDAENIFAKRFKKLGHEAGQCTINGRRVHVWNGCGIKVITMQQSNFENCTGSENQPVQKTEATDNDCTGCMGCDTHCNVYSSELYTHSKHIETNPCNPCSNDVNEATDAENNLHGLESSTHALYTGVTDLSSFCKDWEYVYQQSINSSNCVKVAMEFAQKRKVVDVQSVVNAVKKLKGVEA